MSNVGSIEAVLSLNSAGFTEGLTSATTALNKFANATSKLSKVNSSAAMRELNDALHQVESSLQLVEGISKKNLSTFSKLANAVNNMAKGLRTLQSDAVNVDQAVNTMNNIFKAFQGTLSSVEFKIKGVSTSTKEMATSEQQSAMTIQEDTNIITRNSQAMQQNATNKLRAMGYTGKLSSEENRLAVSEEKVATSSNQATSSIQRQSSAMNQGSASANRMSTATNGLGRAMSNLRMMGTMVGSMIAYNFLHNLAMATTETIHSKSEMEGYFQMLHLTTGEVNDFNKALEETVKLYPRLNKYNLGETISSVGVEFDLSIDEMKKAMPIVSMITSEYLRAGRNANEASLAVKDILQGEFQRLSRETGVKKEDLIEAGWSGDNTDVMGLLDALDKVGKSRNWDEFVAKANSLNDAIMILQNRFGEWSADMVNAVQPAILNAFNSIMSFAEGLSQSIGGLWQWMNGGSWGAMATNIGLVATAVYSLTTAFAINRTGAGLLELRNTSLTRTIYSLITGTKLEQMANLSTRDSIMAKILGLESEVVAEKGLTTAINESLLVKKLSTVEEDANAVSRGLNTASIQAQMVGVTAETDAEELNTLAKQLNSVATVESTGTTVGFTGALWGMITGEGIAEGATLSLTGSIGALTGAFLASPVGWFAVAILGLASAFYVLSGGLDDSWGKMKQFKEAMKDTDSAMQPHTEYLRKLEEEVGATDDKYKRASESVKDFYKNLQSSKSQYDKSELDFENINIKMRGSSDKLFENYGIPKEKAEEYNASYDYLLLGKDKYYHADQVLNKQIDGENSNYGKNMREYIEKFGDDSEKFGEYSKKLTGNYQNLAEHSYIANTSDDWWEWLWNSFYAGMDQFWIDWDNFWADPQWTGVFDGLKKAIELRFFGGENILPSGDEIVKAWDGFWKGVNDGLSDWQKGAVDFLKPLDNLGDEFNKFMSDPLKYLGIADDLTNFSNFFDGLKTSISEAWNNFMSFDWLLGTPVSAENGESHPPVLDEMYQVIVQPIVDWWNGFMADPLSYIGNLAESTNIGTLISALLGSDSMDFTWATDFVNNTIITPLSTAWNTFISDPLSLLPNLGEFNIGHLLSILLGGGGNSDDPNAIDPMATFINNIITNLSNGIIEGIRNIPIVGSIAEMLGLVPQENNNAYQTGYNLIDNLKRGVEDKIRDIPIIGDIAQMLGLIPSQNDNAHGKGYGIGDNIKRGEAEGHRGIGDNVRDEMNNVITAISNKFGEAYATAHDIGSRILNGIKDALDMHSPSIISRELIANEFGLYIPQAITDSSDIAYQSAYQYGQQISDGISATNFNTIGFDSAVGEYQADAQMVADSSYLMGTTTTTAFNDMTLAVNQSTTNMQGNVVSSYSQMQQSQAQLLNNMKQSNTTAYNEMYLKSNQSLLQMRDSTSNVTQQMIGAWDHMKNSIIASANQLKNDSSSHFNQLSDTIGSFYRKIQNPSNWGAGSGSNGAMVRGARHSSVGKSFAGAITRRATHHGAGGSSLYNGREEMTIGALKRMICPNGDCGNLFNGYSMTDKVNVEDFIASITGEHGFGWGDWSGHHYDYIRTTSNAWRMTSPVINLAGGIPTNSDFKVGDFENGTPNISFSSFVSMAEAIFSRIPYRYYYDSAWKGSWLGALQAGACNCSDGADALMAFAQTCNPNWSVSKQWGKWGKDGHFWAVINGKVMDTTAWQGGYGWTSPKVSGYGSPMVRRASHGSGSPDGGNKPVNVTININEPVYGVDSLDEKIQESVKAGLREEFNDPYTVPI